MIATQIPRELFILLCGAGVLQGLYLCLHVIGSSFKRTNGATSLLSVLLLLLSLRVAKSAGWILFSDMHIVTMNLGFAAHFAIGPVLYLYLRQFLHGHGIFLRDWAHLIPSASIVLLSPFLNLGDFWYVGGYGFLLGHQVFYHLFASSMIWRALKSENICAKDRIWIFTLFCGVGLFQLVYVSNYLLGLISYAWAPLIFVLIIYAISYVAVMRNGLFTKSDESKKYRNIRLGGRELRRYQNELDRLMNEKKPWLDPDFSLGKLSAISGIPGYLVSHIINDRENVNFSTFINNYRIKEAKSRLIDPDFSNLTIAAIATDCGFHSLSSFNRAFKREVNATPSQYRRLLQH